MEIVDASTDQIFVTAVARRLVQELDAGRRVVWLIAADDNLSSIVTVMNLLHTTDLSNLVIMQANELAGEGPKVASYWLNLQHIGFNPAPAIAVPVLRAGVDPRNDRAIADSYRHLLQGYIETADMTIGMFTLSDSGSIAGLAPDTPSVDPDAREFVSYEKDGVNYFTVSANFIRKLRGVYVHAIGPNKVPQLERLKEDHDVNENPAQILKRCPEVYIYS